MHTLNTEGNLGSFVDPYRCSCQTCVDYVAEQMRPQATSSELQPTATNVGLTTEPPQIQFWTPPRTSSSLVAPPLVRVNAFADALGRRRSPELQEETLMQNILRFRDQLRLQKAEVYTRDGRSQDEMCAADMEWAELDHKIAALDTVLEVFRVPRRLF